MQFTRTTPDTPNRRFIDIDNAVQVGQVIVVGNRQYAVTHIERIESSERAAIWLRPVDYRQHAASPPVTATEFADAIAAAIALHQKPVRQQ